MNVAGGWVNGFGDEIVAITSYFNPVGYRSRRENYRQFRARLAAPLITVELGYGGRFELAPEASTKLIQIETDQVLWQKERLLNVALEALPATCRYVVWLDCDLVFGRADWLEATAAALERHALVQPYDRVHDLEKGADPDRPGEAASVLDRPSMAARWVDGSFDRVSASTDSTGQHSPGHAWAVRREALEGSGLYDAMILGSGDYAIAMAAIGRWDEVIAAYGMNPRQATHYRRWSEDWHARVQGRLGVVEGSVYHLWHGALSDRGYERRYPSIERHGFDPLTDIAVAENGSWRWASRKPAFHRDVRSYFESRKEDA